MPLSPARAIISGYCFEAFKTACLPNFLLLRESLPKIGRMHKALLNYCQYSSRYQRYLNGENPNTFNPAFSQWFDYGYRVLLSGVGDRAMGASRAAFRRRRIYWKAE
ncbi:oxidoreductase [Salmonella enterica subsp. enterica]|uniref:Oxidoreductase n=1 Tax=Salmonella enterica I TaxID=59201 RepID=A0A3S4HVU5_SALET|nr:oxidoreductase [Salmonella enterica subsp. enterica]